MAITWGKAIKSGTSELRIGIDVDFVSQTDSTLTARARFYVWTKYKLWDSYNTFKTSGWLGGYSGNVDISTSSGTAWSSSNQKLIRTNSNVVINKAYGATQKGSVSCSLTGIEAVGISNTATATVFFTVPARPYVIPLTPYGFVHVRNSDTSNTVSWGSNSTTAAPYTSVLLERSVNGGAWIQIASLPGTVTSYADTTTVANNSYQYRARAYNSSGYSAYSALSTRTYNTPTAPSAPVAALISFAAATLTWQNPTSAANQWEVERSVNGGAFALIATVATLSHTDNAVPAGTVTYRVRAVNTRGTVLKSAYSGVSNSLIAVAPPAAPTLTAISVIVDSQQESVRAAWTYNTVDGSDQTAYELEVSGDIYTGTTAKYVDIITDTLELGEQQWRVRTKGLHASWGPWSAYSSFAVYAAPSVSISSPAIDDETITDLPLVISWDYSDVSGAQASYALAIIDLEAGRLLYSKTQQGADTNISLSVDDLVPPDGREYKIELTVRSSSSLYATADRYFRTDYDSPAEPLIYAAVDDDDASALITVAAGQDEDAPETESISLFRSDADGELLIASGLGDGESVTDYTPPVGIEYTYRAVAVSPAGAVSLGTSEPLSIDSRSFFVNFGPGFGQVAKVSHDIAYGPNDYDSGQVLVQFEGRRDPSLFNASVRTMTSSLSGSLIALESVRAFKQLAEWGKRAWFRSPSGASYPCSIGVAITELPHKNKVATVDLKISRLSHD